jgi:hypothetical protein
MENNWSWDSPWDVYAMSNYNSITSIAESPLLEGLIYVGTDDGLINITEDGGTTWSKIEVGELPNVPKTAFVNDIKADLFDVSTLYVALDNHKFGDLNPYLLKSTDRGNSWRSIKANLPDRSLVWRLVQDHVNPNLLFTATEFGVYFTIDEGTKWIKLTGGVPTISFRDLVIHRRENDLVGATFGRGFYILDDYSVLRDVSEDQLKTEATLFPTRKAWWYIPNPLGDIGGASHFTAPNPPYGAVFTYYLKEDIKTKKQIRKEKESEQIDGNQKVSFPGWDEVEAERRQDKPKIWLTVEDNKGNVIRRIEGSNTKGFSRVAWNLKWPPTNAIVTKENVNGGFTGARVAPGEYTITLSKEVDGVVTDLSEPMPIKVERMYKGALDGADPQVTAKFWRETEILNKSVTAASKVLEKSIYKVELMQKALSRTPAAPGHLDTDLHQLRQDLFALDEKLNGNRSKREAGEKNNPTIRSRLNMASFGTFSSTYGPTETLKNSLKIAGNEFRTVKAELDIIVNDRLPKIERAMIDAGAPWMEGQPIPDY